MDAMPPVRYARASDGVRIAYYTLGRGPHVLVLMPNPSTHLALEWQVPALRGLYESLARTFTVVRLDYRGAGLSERDVPDLTLEDVQADIDAVLTAVGAATYGVFSWGFGAVHGVLLASRQGGAVSQLVLTEPTILRNANPSLNWQLAGLRESNSSVQAQMRSALIAGWSDSDNASAMMRLLEGATEGSYHLWRKLLGHVPPVEVLRKAMPAVAAPALVIHAAGDQLLPIDAARTFASDLPNARLRVLDSALSFAPLTDQDAVSEAVSFLSGGRPAPAEVRSGTAANLTEREKQVLSLIAAGRTNDEIARELFLSASTVSHHVTAILTKTGLGNRTEAAAYAHRNGIA